MWCPLHIRCLWWSCYCACCTISWASSRLKEVSTNRFQQLGNKFDKDYGIRTHWHCFWFVFLFNTVWDGEWSNQGASSPGSTQRMSPLFWCLAQPESSLRNLRSGTCCKGNGKTPRFHSKFYGYVQMVHSVIGGGKKDETWVRPVEGVDMVSNVPPCIWQHCLRAPVLLYLSQTIVPRFWRQSHVRSGHPRSRSFIKLLKRNSLYPHSFHHCLSFVLDIPKELWWTPCSHFHHHEKVDVWQK